MQPTSPLPLPKSPRAAESRRDKLLFALALIPTICIVACIFALMVLYLCGLVRPFFVPTGAMAPAVSGGDKIMMEGVTFLSRQPRRGDIVIFKTDGIVPLRSATIFAMRVAGEPGDHVRISAGKLFINDKQVTLSNAVGEITYDLPPQAAALSPQTDVTVPSGCFFVLGDNSTNSFDSRFWGSVPRGNIIGRVSFCYWPPERIGGVK